MSREAKGKLRNESSVGKKNGIKNTTTPGYTNHYQERNMGMMGNDGNMKGPKSYRMHYLLCGFEYKVNGCDIWLRKCLTCQK